MDLEFWVFIPHVSTQTTVDQYEIYCEGSVILGNYHTFLVKGIETIKLKMHNGAVMILQDVWYIPKLKRKLIYLGMLEAKGFCK